jgi:hypothetical protein
LIWYAAARLLRSRAALQTEILVVRHQLNVRRRKAPKRVAVRNIDRLVFAGLYRLAPEVLVTVEILKPETIIRWHRAVRCAAQAACVRRQSWASYTIDMFEFEFPTGTGVAKDDVSPAEAAGRSEN